MLPWSNAAGRFTAGSERWNKSAGLSGQHGRSDDARHEVVDLVPRRIGWDRRLWQPLLPRARRKAGASRRWPRQPREALGYLQRRAGGIQGAARVARLAAPHGERIAAF